MLVPAGIVVSIVQSLLVGGFGLVGIEFDRRVGGLDGAAAVRGGHDADAARAGVVQAATVRALVEIDEGAEVGPLRAYALAFDSVRPLLRGLGIAVGTWVVLT